MILFHASPPVRALFFPDTVMLVEIIGRVVPLLKML